MAFNELALLSDKELIAAIDDLEAFFYGVRAEQADRGYYVPADDYQGEEEQKRLDLLIAEASRRGLTPPDRELQEEG